MRFCALHSPIHVAPVAPWAWSPLRHRRLAKPRLSPRRRRLLARPRLSPCLPTAGLFVFFCAPATAGLPTSSRPLRNPSRCPRCAAHPTTARDRGTSAVTLSPSNGSPIYVAPVAPWASRKASAVTPCPPPAPIHPSPRHSDFSVSAFQFFPLTPIDPRSSATRPPDSRPFSDPGACLSRA